MQRLNSFVRSALGSDRVTTVCRWLKARTGSVFRLAREVPPVRRVMAVEVVLVLVLAALSAEILWSLLSPTAFSSQPIAVRAGPTVTSSIEARSRLTLLTAQDLFHRGQVSNSALTSAELNAPKTLLNLELFGVRFGNDIRRGSAIIRTPDNAQDVYLVGQDIVDGVRLEHVMRDRVVIRRNGIAESLFLDGEQIADVVVPESAAVDPEAEVNRSYIDGGAAALFSQVEIRPRDSGDGVIISPRGNGELFRQAGIASGDVLVAVNGTPIAGVDSLATLANTLQNVNEIVLRLERDGRSETRRIMVKD